MKNRLKKIAYFLLAIISGKRGVQRTINHFKVRFPARWSRYYESNYESENYQFLKEQAKAGMHIIDIGAHLGLFSVISSQLVCDSGKIVCFEPTPGTYAILEQTLKMNHCDNVIPVQGAISNMEGSAVFYVSETPGYNSNSLVKNKQGEEVTAADVKLFTIDGVVHTFSLHPGLIKIDAEGAELDVLQGGVKTFRQFKPMLILGLHPLFIKQKGDSLEKIWDLVEQSGYQVKENGKIVTKTDFCSRSLLFDVHCM